MDVFTRQGLNCVFNTGADPVPRLPRSCVSGCVSSRRRQSPIIGTAARKLHTGARLVTICTLFTWTVDHDYRGKHVEAKSETSFHKADPCRTTNQDALLASARELCDVFTRYSKSSPLPLSLRRMSICTTGLFE